MIELIIFLLPIISGGVGVYQKMIRVEESAFAFVDYANKYGVKARTLNSPHFFLQSFAYIISPLFINLGWAWMTLGGVLLVMMGIYFLFSDGKSVTPSLYSSEFDSLIVKRKKQALFSFLLMVLWLVSWGVEYS